MDELIQIVIGVNENCRMNEGTWSDWKDSYDMCEVYGIADLSSDEHEILNRAIKSNGMTLFDDLQVWEREAYGQNFAGSDAEIEGRIAAGNM